MGACSDGSPAKDAGDGGGTDGDADTLQDGGANDGSSDDASEDAAVDGSGDDGAIGPRPDCGNAKPDDGEECDDGNLTSGDGCSDRCEVEDGFECPVMGASCELCGDGIRESTEACDDGNREDGDGCDAECELEEGAWACPIEGEPCELCGDGIRDTNERCDDGNTTSGDGCSDMCRSVDDGYVCAEAGQPCSYCGNGEIELGEVCDDGNRSSGDGCVANCRAVEPGWTCPTEGQDCTLCGDGVLDEGESCDDGNFRDDDGCTQCMLDSGAVCPIEGATCSVCGNGIIEPTVVDDAMTTLEECDDGNQLDDDGCSANCLRDPAYDCLQPGVSCSQCGDGVVSGFESCDDGSECVGGDEAGAVCMLDADCNGGSCEPVGDDGCSAQCQTEPNFNCPGDGGPCAQCGNGTVEDGEVCDDGMHCTDNPTQSCEQDADCGTGTCAPLSGDGCSRRCTAVEEGATCAQDSEGTTHCAFCGDGVVDTLLDTNDSTVLFAEACDDGNTESDDGCAGDCTAEEEGYNCFFDGFDCALCGDGELQPGEKCDEGSFATAGCDERCQIVEPWVCPLAGEACTLCGDGQLDVLAEGCDDGNLRNEDGCSADCQVESGYVCPPEGECASASCGDGFRAGDEECDDGNSTSGDGCNFVCDVEDGWTCSGSQCRRTRCGDGVTEGTEQCDDGSLCVGGAADGQDCSVSATACTDGGGSCAARAGDGCDASCELEIGYACPPGQPCRPTTCSDGVVEGAEQCDDSGICSDASGNPGSICNSNPECTDGGTCEPQANDGCDTRCQLEEGYHCPVAGAPCEMTVCGDGLIQGLETCDDGGFCVGGDRDGQDCTGDAAACDAGGGVCMPATGDGCSDICRVEKLYSCTGEPSTCKPILEFVAVRKFRVENVSPDGLSYDPVRRSFAGHKQANSKAAIELCLDGTILNKNDTEAGPHGTIFFSDSTIEALPASYVEPPRAQLGQLAGATYDPFTGHILFVTTAGVLAELPPAYGGVVGDIQETLDGSIGSPSGLTVGEDGNLYVTDSGSDRVYVIERDSRICLGGSNDGQGCDVGGDCDSGVCSAQDIGSGNRNTSFVTTPTLANWSHPVSNNLGAIFTVPGEGLLGTFATPADGGALSQCVGGDNDGADCTGNPGACTGGSCQTLPQFSFWNPTNLAEPLFERSTLPGLLFSYGLITDDALPYSSSSEAAAAETAADGGAFIICSRNSSAPCLLFARGCQSDAECQAVQPGTSCNFDVPQGGVPYCAARGAAIDDRSSAGAEESEVRLDVLANDRRSESACVDPSLKVVALTGGDGVLADDRFCQGGSMAGANCVGDPFLCEGGTCESSGTTSVTTERGGTATIVEAGGAVTYDAPSGGQTTCGFIDTFEYTADLGGGVLDTATVRVLVACVCGDGVVQAGEQCDCGEDPGALPGSCTTPNGALPARCSDECLLNVVCGDDIVDPGEQCDDGRHCSDAPTQACTDDTPCAVGTCVPTSGDGCSRLCTLEFVCGNGIEEGAEECDDGNDDAGDGCNANCTIPRCGDGVVDADNPDGAEQCDDGINNGPLPSTCSAQCRLNTECGNGTIEGFEQCDDGNLNPGDGCSTSCEVEGACGDGEVDAERGEECDPAHTGAQCTGSTESSCTDRCLCTNYCGDGRIGGLEDCDDGNGVSGDGCSADCRDEFCGDGVTQPELGEECDDGNDNPADSCTNDCRVVTRCGNAIIDQDEECDDGNKVSGDGCSSNCIVEKTVCGDGQVDFDEECDDGNTQSGDGCSARCRSEAMCGNGVVDLGEECDDGNTQSGDGCSDSCLVEIILI